ncbi:MAG: RIO1 family regulatory kinase/ATPase [Candidatus Aenigmarchaeota archaeon]|nr:serine protein kinase RIO [Candidatus Aenigmarchaeota archaeon]MDW8149633.1 RIO1 family regulatory kinase/ATPase [Candidatus Aenigmarchaeota archaeon]
MLSYEVEKKVFSPHTLANILKLKSKGIIKYLEGVVKEGKESVVYSAKDFNDNFLAIKIYRVEHCDFKRMYNLLITDERIKNLKKSRYKIVAKWAEREFDNMKIAYDAGVSMAKPITFLNNVLVMEFLGIDGKPFPRLCDVKIDEEIARKLFEEIIDDVKKLLNKELIHGDLSIFNILFDGNKHYLIDFSHGVKKSNILWKSILKRDLENLVNYFKKYFEVDNNFLDKFFQEI